VWFFIVLICLLVLLILLLCIPFNFSLKATAADSIACSFRIRWFFGLIRKDISGQKKTNSEKQREHKKRNAFRVPLSVLFNTSFRHQLFVLLKRALSHTRIRQLSIDLRLGLDDPADTWQIATAALWTTLFMHPPFPHAISIQPCFTDEFLIKGEVSGDAQITPISMVAPIVRFAFSAPALKLIACMVQTRWKRKKYI